jgi:hypothetical protein
MCTTDKRCRYLYPCVRTVFEISSKDVGLKNLIVLEFYVLVFAINMYVQL